jgi:hypothetical protein
MYAAPRPLAPATYEVELNGDVCAVLRREFPSMTIHHRPVETVLHKAVIELAELDALLQHLQSLGVVLSEIRVRAPYRARPASHRASDMSDRRPAGTASVQPGEATRCYDVHVEGRLGSALLRYLGWFSWIQPAATGVRIETGPDDLIQFLASCWARELVVDHVVRLDPQSASLPTLNRPT